MIEFREVTYDYRKNTAISDLNLKVDEGMIGLLGENGAGKTTLMKLLATLISLKKGEIKINGIDVNHKNYNKIRKLVGYMPQELGFYDNYTVYEMLEYVCLLEKMKLNQIRSNVMKLLEELNLKRYMNRKIKELSGGMKRRLGLACAMVNNPEILIVDEPTVGLDPEERIKMRNLIKKYSKGRTVILSTHIVEDIKSICDKLIVISKGRLMYYGTVTDLIDASPNVYEVRCKTEQIEEFNQKGVITDIVYMDDNSCILKIVSKESVASSDKVLRKSLETSYMYMLKNCNEYEEDKAEESSIRG